MESFITRKFASNHASHLSSEKFVASGCWALLNVLASAFIVILKHDICQGISKHRRFVADVVDKAFSSTDTDIEEYFYSAGDHWEVKSLMEYLYYVAGCHAHSIKEAIIRRRDGLRELIWNVHSNIIIGKDIADGNEILIQKVERVEVFDVRVYLSWLIFVCVADGICLHGNIYIGNAGDDGLWSDNPCLHRFIVNSKF